MKESVDNPWDTPLRNFFSFDEIDSVMIKLGQKNSSVRGIFRNNIQAFMKQFCKNLGGQYGELRVRDIPWDQMVYLPPDLFQAYLSSGQEFQTRMKGRGSSEMLREIMNHYDLPARAESAATKNQST